MDVQSVISPYIGFAWTNVALLVHTLQHNEIVQSSLLHLLCLCLF